MTKALISLLFMKCIFTSFGSISVPTVNLYKISFVNDSNSVSLMSSNEKDYWLIKSKINIEYKIFLNIVFDLLRPPSCFFVCYFF